MAHAVHTELATTKNNTMNEQFESTYGLIVRSEERGRGILEIVLYAIFGLSVITGIWQMARTPVNISAPGIEQCTVCQGSEMQAVEQHS
jgi:hypothetical protein